MNPSVVRKMSPKPTTAAVTSVDDSLTIDQRINSLFDLFDKHGQMNYVGENVTQMQHAQQVGQYARDACQPIHVILGAFLHDIGHLVGIDRHMQKMTEHGLNLRSNETSIGTRTHEKVGGDYLRELGFPKCVIELVEGHVKAKRYLVFRDEAYHKALSRASQMTLRHQGGPMTAEEAKEFETCDNFHTILDLRHWDDLGKEQSVPATQERTDFYKTLCKKLLVAQEEHLKTDMLTHKEEREI